MSLCACVHVCHLEWGTGGHEVMNLIKRLSNFCVCCWCCHYDDLSNLIIIYIYKKISLLNLKSI